MARKYSLNPVHVIIEVRDGAVIACAANQENIKLTVIDYDNLDCIEKRHIMDVELEAEILPIQDVDKRIQDVISDWEESQKNRE